MVFEGVKTIKINLKNGVYILQRDGGVGKTYLAKLLSKEITWGYKVCVVTFMANQVVVLGNLSEAELIMFDRYDVYWDEVDVDLQELGKRAIVLMDCKGFYDNLSFGVKRASVEYKSNNLLEVS